MLGAVVVAGFGDGRREVRQRLLSFVRLGDGVDVFPSGRDQALGAVQVTG
ncbi:hypothetical protein [Streptomyces chiangmaiensis]|uniref:Uncharacterized protein n=1 Tax=Streptomyces chiangmaiensis TaxID=766497 RepID=A0ABU7FQN5_9ACTN|nr:hypothetical protein [Streptomyces chiangmaiensis]MED7826436.1 hypothetical protein [Streptomyces chiangmaiensis]